VPSSLKPSSSSSSSSPSTTIPSSLIDKVSICSLILLFAGETISIYDNDVLDGSDINWTYLKIESIENEIKQEKVKR
jgi:hypothetical protein